MELLVIDPKEFQITEEKAKEITAGLPQIIKERAILEQQYSEIINEDITEEVSKRARELRLLIHRLQITHR